MLIPGSPLGLLIEGVQVLAGVLLPSATVFLLLLCNDKAVLGPWVNGRWTNAITGVVIALLITLSLVLTASVAYPAHQRRARSCAILAACAAVAAAAAAGWLLLRRGRAAHRSGRPPLDRAGAGGRWRMPPLATLAAPPMSAGPQGRPARHVGLPGGGHGRGGAPDRPASARALMRRRIAPARTALAHARRR